MALTPLDGGWLSLIGPGLGGTPGSPGSVTVNLDAASEACIFIGQIFTSDGASHTIDTTGSSSLGWRSGAATFANVSTVVIVGIAPVLTTAGPPGRAVNVADVISFDVSKTMTGGGGGITGSAWQTHVPDTGTKTIANGDSVAFGVQMLVRGGADVIRPTFLSNANGVLLHSVTTFTGGSYGTGGGNPDAVITFSDGALGFFLANDVFSTFVARTWSSGDATKEYGQLYKLPFPVKVYGIYGSVAAAADFDLVLYSDPLGTPVAEKTISIDANTVTTANGIRFFEMFASPYTTTADQNIAAVFKPGASNISAYFRTLASAAHRVSDPWGLDGYGVSRASGAFADANSSLDHYQIGLIIGAYDNAASSGGGPVGQQCV